MRSFALLALVGAAAAQTRGFNYGATNNDGSGRTQQDFENLFNRANSLQGTSGFTSGRLYTMIQEGTTDGVTSAIPAAIASKTSLLLGLWASQDQAGFNNEINALKAAISQYGTQLTDLISGISVGSEDLYRETPTGIENHSGIGASPDQLTNYIGQVRSAIANTPWSGAKVGHVDTWTAWVNGSNVAVVDAVDFLGMDGYPYFQTVNANSIDNAADLFFQSYNATVGAAKGKEVWVTETGFPVQGPTSGQAVPSVANAETYWQEVACKLLGSVNTWWYTLYDPQASGAVSFGVVGPNLDSAPYYDLTCKDGANKPASSSSAPAKTSSAAEKTSSVATASSTPAKEVTSAPATEKTTAPVTESSAPATEKTTAPPTEETTAPYVKPSQSSPVQEISDGQIQNPATGNVKTMYSTTLVTITGCSAEYTTSGASKPTTSPSTGSGAGKSCPAALTGDWQYPHLIVPVDSSEPNKALGTQYNGTITPTTSTIFDFDIPASYAGKTCSLVFLFPEKKDLETSSYSFNGKGGLNVIELASPATASTTYANAPKAAGLSKTIPSVAPGNSYTIFSHECGAGQRIAFEFESVGGLDLEYFQDYNPSPLGAYVTAC